MAILIDGNTTVLIQGITGREGNARTRFMLDYGTKVLCGITPGRGGTEVWKAPVAIPGSFAARNRGVAGG